MPNAANTKRSSLATLAQAITNGWQAMVDTFSNGQQYSPGEPLTPMYGNDEPWRYQLTVGQNLFITPRAQLTAFQTLRQLADSTDLIRICIETRKEQLGGAEWDIVPTSKEDKTNYKEQIKIIKDFFNYPDRVHTFKDWLSMGIEDSLVIDAPTIYKRRTKGNALFALEMVDGATIKPLVDANGRTPIPPLPAYQQVIYGYPRGQYTIDELLYRPRNLRTHSIYGFSPVEYILMCINIALRRQQHFLNYYTEGTLPDAGLFSVPDTWTAEQIIYFQEKFDIQMAGNSAARQRLKFVPNGSYHATKDFKYDKEYDAWLARVISAAFGVNPQMFVQEMNKATAQVHENIQGDIGLKPLMVFWQSIFSEVIAKDFALPELCFRWIEDKKENEDTEIKRNVEYVKVGILGIDEVRANKLGLDPLVPGGIPPMVLTGAGPVWLTPETISAGIEQTVNPPMPQITAAEQQQKGKAENNNSNSGGKEPPKATNKPAAGKIMSEIKQWEKFEVARLKKKDKRDFVIDAIPATAGAIIRAKLKTANTESEVRAVFALFKADKPGWEKGAANKRLQEYIRQMRDDLNEARDDFISYIEDKSLITVETLLQNYQFIGAGTQTVSEQALYDMMEFGWQAGIDRLNGIVPQAGGITLDFPELRASQWANDNAATLITQLNDTTRDMIANTVSASVKNGETYLELKDKLMQNYGFSDRRAETIARTESGAAYNIGAVQSWQASGLVEAIYVTDGDADEECAAANGSTWSFDEAMENPLAHPNCTREFFPVMVDQTEQDSDEAED